MADWSHPVISDPYQQILGTDSAHGYLPQRDIDSATMFSDLLTTATNIPTGTVRFNRTNKTFEEWTGAAWSQANLAPLALSAGGTAGVDAPSARTALGLGSMALQNSTSVSVTGGTITGTKILAPPQLQIPAGVDLF